MVNDQQPFSLEYTKHVLWGSYHGNITASPFDEFFRRKGTYYFKNFKNDCYRLSDRIKSKDINYIWAFSAPFLIIWRSVRLSINILAINGLKTGYSSSTKSDTFMFKCRIISNATFSTYRNQHNVRLVNKPKASDTMYCVWLSSKELKNLQAINSAMVLRYHIQCYKTLLAR